MKILLPALYKSAVMVTTDFHRQQSHPFVMDNLCASGVELLPEKSRLSQMNTATNKVNLIPSHYPPPGIAEADRTIGGTELLDGKFIVPPKAHPFSICIDFEQKGVLDRNGSKDSEPPPLPPREPTGCSSAVVRSVPSPISPAVKDVLHKHPLNLSQVGGGQSDGSGGQSGRFSANIGFDCFGTLAVPGVQHEPVLANSSSPMSHHEHHHMLQNVDDITHHNWNAIQANLSSNELVMNKDFYPANQVLDDKHCDGSLKMASTNLQTAVLNQVIPLSRWPIGSRQPETHFALDRVVARPQAGNEYVDSPLHAQNKEQPPHLTPKRSNTLTTRSETSLRDCNAVIMTQPSPSGIKSSQEDDAGKASDRANSRHPPPPPCKQGLICPRCNKCRCMACTQPRRLPSCWIGRSFYQCECSAQQAVNICSCLCCVQALFYHCLYHPDDEDDLVIEPCACCERQRCCLRWMIMGLLLPVLPCLCLYCPLQCALDACTACYNGCSRRGCHCGRDASSSGSSTTRDLLLDSEPSST